MNYLNNYYKYEKMFIENEYELNLFIDILNKEIDRLSDIYQGNEINKKYHYLNKKFIYNNSEFFPFNRYNCKNNTFLIYLLGRLYLLSIYLEDDSNFKNLSVLFKITISEVEHNSNDILVKKYINMKEVKKELSNNIIDFKNNKQELIDSNELLIFIDTLKKGNSEEVNKEFEKIKSNNQLVFKNINKSKYNIVLNKKI